MLSRVRPRLFSTSHNLPSKLRYAAIGTTGVALVFLSPGLLFVGGTLYLLSRILLRHPMFSPPPTPSERHQRPFTSPSSFRPGVAPFGGFFAPLMFSAIKSLSLPMKTGAAVAISSKEVIENHPIIERELGKVLQVSPVGSVSIQQLPTSCRANVELLVNGSKYSGIVRVLVESNCDSLHEFVKEIEISQATFIPLTLISQKDQKLIRLHDFNQDDAKSSNQTITVEAASVKSE